MELLETMCSLKYIKELIRQFKEFEIVEKKETCTWGKRKYIRYFYKLIKDNKQCITYEFETKKTIKDVQKWYVREHLMETAF